MQKRHQELVMQHLAQSDEIAAGLRALPKTKEAFSATQAAWRFYKNDKITLPKLIEPIIEYARSEVEKESQEFLLCVQDWSGINYSKHTRKQDSIRLHIEQWGYDLQTALLVSASDGAPIAPVYLGLKASDGVHSTRSEKNLIKRTHLDEVTKTIQHIEGLKLGKQLVHIIDAEADSVMHLRRINKAGYSFVIRGNLSRLVLYGGKEVAVSEVLKQMADSYSYNGLVDYKGKEAHQYLAQTLVTLHRPAKLYRKDKKGKRHSRYVKGKALILRLIVSQVRDKEGKELATWLLWTNLAEVSAETIALWYYWRWRIESYFKLLKSAGHHIEQWQQETASSTARRLLIAAQACLIVWHLARSQAQEADSARKLLVRFSGRLIKRGKTFTLPALLSGTWVLLALLDALEHYSLDELKQMANFILPWRYFDSG